MTQRRNVAFLFLFSAAILVTLSFLILYLALVVFGDGDVSFGEGVAVVDIRGEIYYDLWKIDEIDSYRENGDVKAVVLHINSPGGGVAASQAIYHAVRKLAEEKPVVAMMGPVAASGGYYIACAADSIIAYEGTLTGSIGVIAAFLNTQELYRKIGLDVTVVKAGQYKDVGSPHREMTPEEEEYLGALIDRLYRQFLQAVSVGRGMPLDRIDDLAEGRLYSGEEAVEVGLVDRIGTYDDALRMAAGMAGIEGEPKVIRKRRKRSLLERVLGQTPPRLPLYAEDRVRLQYIIP